MTMLDPTQGDDHLIQVNNFTTYLPDLAPSDYQLFSPMKEGLRGKHYDSNKEVKIAVMKWFNSQQNFAMLGYMPSFEGGTLLLKETVTVEK